MNQHTFPSTEYESGITGPLGVGDLLDRSFRLFRFGFTRFLATAAIILVPLSILSAAWTGQFFSGYLDMLQILSVDPSASPGQVFGATPLGPVGYFGSIFILAIASVVGTGVVAMAITYQSATTLRGSRVGSWESLSLGLRRFGSFLALRIVQGLAIIGAFLAGMVPFFLAAIVAGALFGGFAVLNQGQDFEGVFQVLAIAGTIVLLVCGVIFFYFILLAPPLYLIGRWIVVIPAMIIEDLGAVDALRRSWDLTRGNVLRSLGYWLILYIFFSIVVSVPLLVIQQGLGFFFLDSGNFVFVALYGALNGVATLLWTPFSLVAIVLFYYDLRVRRESYDLELQIAQMEEQVPLATDGEG